MRWHNALLLTAAKEGLNISSAEASAFLHQRVAFPSKMSKSGYTEKSVYQYLKQAQSYFYTSIRQTAVKAFVASLHEYSRQSIGRMEVPLKSKRATLMLCKAEAVSLLADDTFLKDVASWPALLDAVAAVAKFLCGGSKFTELNAVPWGRPAVVCLLGHLALVAVKVQEHLKRVAELQAGQQGMSPGHHGVWVTMLDTLHRLFDLSSMPQRGIRLVDGEDSTRWVVPLYVLDADEMADFEGDESDEEGADGADGADDE